VTNNLYTLLARTLVDFGDRVMPTGQVTRAPATTIIVDGAEAHRPGRAGEVAWEPRGRAGDQWLEITSKPVRGEWAAGVSSGPAAVRPPLPAGSSSSGALVAVTAGRSWARSLARSGPLSGRTKRRPGSTSL
jgi:hypothetical protein